MAPLVGGIFAFSGTLSMSRSEFAKKIAKHGGVVRMSGGPSVTHLVCSEAEFEGKSNKVSEAEERGIFIVKECFIDACIAAKKLIVLHGYESQYLFNPTAPKPQKNAAAAAARSAVKAPRKAIKKATAEALQTTKGRGKRSQAQAEDTEEEEVEEQKPTLASKAKRPKKALVQNKSQDDDALKPSSSQGGIIQSVLQVEEVDANFPHLDWGANIIIDAETGKPCSAFLVEKNASKNMDKFYKLQAIQTVSKPGIYFFVRWGKTGTAGQSQLITAESNSEAVDLFKDKIKEKTGWTWEKALESAKPKPGKYTLLKTTTSKQEPTALIPPGHSPMWQYWLSNDADGKLDGWYDYTAEASQNVEECFQHYLNNSWLDVRFVQSGFFQYRVDFKNMTQTNVTHANHTSRPIRRGSKPTTAMLVTAVPTTMAALMQTMNQADYMLQVSGPFTAPTPKAFQMPMLPPPGASINTLPSFPAKAICAAPLPTTASAPPKMAAARIDIINDPSLKKVSAPKVPSYKASDPSQPFFPTDYDILANCVLQLTDMKNNNNKYYSLELHEASQAGGNLYRLYTHYGRTDDLTTSGSNSGQKETRYFKTLQDAKAGYLSIYKEKTRESKGYKPVNLVSSKIGSEKARNQAAGELGDATQAKLKEVPSASPVGKGKSAIKPAKINLHPKVKELVEYIYSEAKQTLTTTANVEITANGIETPLGILSIEQVEQGELVLKELAKEIKKKKKSTEKLLDLSGEFYTAIPHRIGRTREEIKDAVINNLAVVAEKQDLCQLMRDMLEVNSHGQNVLFDQNAVEGQYQALQAEITVVEKSSKEFADIVREIKESQERSHENVFIDKSTIQNIYKVRRPEEEMRFTAAVTTNRRLLFHGSRLANFVGLLSRGILLPKIVVSMGVQRTDGGWLGDGIYFGDADTSYNYATAGSKGTKLMLINLVALGRMKDFEEITYGLTSPPQGYDSCHGVKGTEFDDDEYVVYSECQQKIQYLVETY